MNEYQTKLMLFAVQEYLEVIGVLRPVDYPHTPLDLYATLVTLIDVEKAKV